MESIIVFVVVAWTYLGLLSIRWDRHEVLSLGRGRTRPVLSFLCWWLALPLMWYGRPHRAWMVIDPKPTQEERVAVAEALSLKMEQEAGLRFDGIFLLPDRYEANIVRGDN